MIKEGSGQDVSFSQCSSSQSVFPHYFTFHLLWVAVLYENMTICMSIMLQFAWYTTKYKTVKISVE